MALNTRPLELYIYNFDGEWQALIDDYVGLVWTITDQPGGAFELVMPYNESVFEWAIPTVVLPGGAVQLGNIIAADIFDTGNPNFMENCVPMRIDSVLKTQTEDERTITISGKSFDAILEWRVCVPMISIAMGDDDAVGFYPSQIIWTLVQTLATDPRNLEYGTGNDLGPDLIRKFPYCTMDEPPWPMGTAESEEWGPFLNKEYIGTVLYEAVAELCKSWKLGFKIRSCFVNQTVSHVFYLTAGTDYSIGNTDDKGTIILSEDTSFIQESSHLLSSDKYKNVAYIKGAAPAGTSVGVIYTARRPGNPTGFSLREGYIDGSGLPANVDDPAFPTDAYKTILRMSAADYLYGDNGAYIDVVEGDIYPSYELGKDYGLGDSISLEGAYGDIGKAQVTAIEFAHDESSRSLRPIFSFENRDVILYDENGDPLFGPPD